MYFYFCNIPVVRLDTMSVKVGRSTQDVVVAGID